MNKPRLWTKDFIIVSLLNFSLVLVFYLLVVVIGQYVTGDLGASVSEAGLVVGVFIVGAMLGRLLIGQNMDVVGRRRSLLAGLALAAFSSALYFVEAGINWLIALRLLHGISLGIASTASSTVVAHLIPASRRGEGIGYFSMSNSLATAIGPFIGIWLAQHSSFDVILLFCCALSVASCGVALLLRVPEENYSGETPPPQRLSFSPSRFLEPRVVPLCVIILLVAVFYSGVLSFVNAYATERQLVQAASFFFMAYSLSVLASRPFTGRLLDARGAHVIMYPAFVLMGSGLLLLGVADSGSMLLVSGCLIGIGFGNMQSCIQAMAIQAVDSNRMALATSTFFIFIDAGLGFGPSLLGLLIPHIGFANMYMLLGALTLLTMLPYLLLHRRGIATFATERRV
ncbi:MFS transporter [Pseudomaricurvus sp. HS19]|uniref:MFS transporter n=1 Tax=Pseudomaricurvus sp. HS19 TaxID=2692626 RepID=UPI00136C21A3|nr:MFS transporter [Pseudomaricurvus sp. HS19]MYM62290.1 MFS transporter [Pseudomaricurvus sp. HS19]